MNLVPAGGDPHMSTCSFDDRVATTSGDALGKGTEVVLTLVSAKMVSMVHVREGVGLVCTVCLSNSTSTGPLRAEMPAMVPTVKTDSKVGCVMHRLVGYFLITATRLELTLSGGGEVCGGEAESSGR